MRQTWSKWRAFSPMPISTCDKLRAIARFCDCTFCGHSFRQSPMTITSPKYAAAEIERRWLVDISMLGSLTDLPKRKIEDRYIAATHMRLRKVSADGQATIFKLGKKYGKSETACTEQVVSIYLSEVEFNTIAVLPGTNATKLRYAVADGSLDVYESPNAGLAIFEIEFASQDDATSYTPPAFADQEITHDPRYSGFALSQVMVDLHN